ncbi:hypothetical protein K469DRAFT_734797, partial [Zopfia rhizophila CBS 207.26]
MLFDEDSVPRCEAEEVQDFCRGARLQNIESGIDPVARRRAAWLDDRSLHQSKFNENSRMYGNPLSPAELYWCLKEKRFNVRDKVNAHRRLIYISNLDPYYILALINTASSHQVSALRDAIWKHLAWQMSIKVKIPPKGYSAFTLEFHVPYFALRDSNSWSEVAHSENRRPSRRWIDLSFLKVRPQLREKSTYGICEAQISLVICGIANSRWVAYSFVDTEFDDEDLLSENSSDENFHEDPIAGTCSNRIIDADSPLWDPREYFLVVVEFRMSQVLKEWRNLVRKVECYISDYRDQLSFIHGRNQTTDDLQQAFDWTMQAIGLLLQLRGCLSETTKAWEIFSSAEGDLAYFSDVVAHRRNLSLFVIKENFEALKC